MSSRAPPLPWILLLACHAPTGGGAGDTGSDTGSDGPSGAAGGAATEVDEPTTGGPTSTTGGPGEPVTYYQHARPVLEARCVGCHKAEGIGPFSVDGLADAALWAEVALGAVEDGSMPPFFADDSGCWPIADARKMPPWERELLRAWVDGGKLAGDPEAPAAVEVELPAGALGAPTRVFDGAVAYTPGGGDEYRCFLVDPGLSATWTFLQAVSVDTDNWARLHHAIVFAIPPELVPAVEQIDADAPGPGWDCYFGPGLAGPVAVGSYSPGAATRPYPGGTSVPVVAGTRFIVEAHFHETFNADPVRLAVTAWEFAQPVTRFPHGLSLFNSNFFIPAGAPSVTAPLAGDFIAADQAPVVHADPNAIQQARAGLIWGLDFHMHMRGKTARVDLVREDGTRQCLLRVNDWHDEWQGPYEFAQPIEARAGDRIEATCEWDNSPENQPVVGGKQLEPVDLTWGFGALDEMCNGNISLTLD